MIVHPTIAVLFITNGNEATLRPLINYLDTTVSLEHTCLPTLPDDLSSYQTVVLTHPASLNAAESDRLAQFVQRGGGCLALTGLSEAPLPTFFGVQPGAVGPAVELRVLFTDPCHALATRLEEAIYLPGTYHPLQVTRDDVETVLYADWRFEHSPMLTTRPVGQGEAAVTSLQALDDVRFQQTLYRLLRQLSGRPNHGETLNMGLLGYSPAVGRWHALGAEAHDGLAFRAACDLSEARLAEAERDFPRLKTYQSSEAFAADDDIDVVVIATPPSSHAKLAVQMLEAGKHVICEKPLALTRAETEAMLAAAEANQRLLGCHQNRRWDVDYLAIRQAVREGLIGALFHVETFVGSYNHPCGYWHSHDAISGGTTYDWGAHYLDWVLSLMPQRITGVIGTRQNRVWHDVTNADQERIQLRFEDGQEAEFIHSDIAAAPKPKWYLLGTEGAIVGQWAQMTAYETDPDHYFYTHELPTTELPPQLTLHRRHASGEIIQQTLATPPRTQYNFHRNLADHLLTGEPLEVPAEHSARVVAVLEAAARSAEKGGTIETI